MTDTPERPAGTQESGYIDTTVAVPRERLAEFYEMFGRWLAGGLPPPATSAAGAQLRQAWGPDDVVLATEFYEWVSPKAAAILDLWMDSAGTWHTGAETAEAAELNAGAYGVAGSLSSVGKASAK